MFVPIYFFFVFLVIIEVKCTKYLLKNFDFDLIRVPTTSDLLIEISLEAYKWMIFFLLEKWCFDTGKQTPIIKKILPT